MTVCSYFARSTLQQVAQNPNRLFVSGDRVGDEVTGLDAVLLEESVESRKPFDVLQAIIRWTIAPPVILLSVYGNHQLHQATVVGCLSE